MKFLRIGKEGQEIPVALDKDGKYRNLSSIIKDLNPENINFETLDKIKNMNLESLEEINQNERIGSCISKPGKFLAVGLNYSDHAAETNAQIPLEQPSSGVTSNCNGIISNHYNNRSGSMNVTTLKDLQVPLQKLAVF